MHQWRLDVRRRDGGVRIRLRNRDGYARQWSGHLARRLCREMALMPGEGCCSKSRVWQLFLLAGTLEQETRDGGTEMNETAMRLESEKTDVGAEGSSDAVWTRRLRDHGLLPTRPRRMIARHILGEARHFTADELMGELQQSGCRCARATVYNTLNEFVEQGLLQVLHVDSGRAIYDTVTAPHAHIYNVDTGELFDLDPEQAWIHNLPPLPAGTSLEGVQLVFRVSEKSLAGEGLERGLDS
jgi:Fur family iron response transcriptional regulator